MPCTGRVYVHAVCTPCARRVHAVRTPCARSSHVTATSRARGVAIMQRGAACSGRTCRTSRTGTTSGRRSPTWTVQTQQFGAKPAVQVALRRGSWAARCAPEDTSRDPASAREPGGPLCAQVRGRLEPWVGRATLRLPGRRVWPYRRTSLSTPGSTTAPIGRAGSRPRGAWGPRPLPCSRSARRRARRAAPGSGGGSGHVESRRPLLYLIAAAFCRRGSNPIRQRLQPYSPEAAALCATSSRMLAR